MSQLKLKHIGSNMVEIETTKATVLFSYSTPVAACMNDGSGFIKTDCRWSATTSRHINKWLNGANAKVVPQATLDKMA